MTVWLVRIRNLLAFCLVVGVAAVVSVYLNGRSSSPVMTGLFEVIDGDTLAKGGERLRLAGMDAPELAQVCRTGQGQEWSCGRVSRRRLEGLSLGGDVVCEGDRRDRYGRLLVHCRKAGRDLGALLVEEGLAVAYGSYGAEERQAQKDRHGIWSGEFERPQAWRDRQRGEGGDGLVAPLLDWLRERLLQGK